MVDQRPGFRVSIPQPPSLASGTGELISLNRSVSICKMGEGNEFLQQGEEEVKQATRRTWKPVRAPEVMAALVITDGGGPQLGSVSTPSTPQLQEAVPFPEEKYWTEVCPGRAGPSPDSSLASMPPVCSKPQFFYLHSGHHWFPHLCLTEL